jgi:23S rRNA (adenine-N6)-dimethyltransferase
VSAELRTRWGFHELTDPWARRLVGRASIRAGDLVVDVGAGRGALTRPLIATGARVIAVELHPRRAARLREQFADDDVIVVRADASDLRLPRRPFHVVANPPFAITTALIRRLTSPHSRLVTATLVLPAYAVARWTKHPPRGFHTASSGELPRRAFHPCPPGRVALLRIVCR